jgi:iron complex transport system permease protein
MKSWVVIRLQKFPISFRINKRVMFVIFLLTLGNIAAAVFNIGVGEYAIPPWDVLKTVVGMGEGDYDFVVNTLRVPRTLVAFLVGVGLAVSGAILQGITRNPLASPGVIGLNAGAGLAAVLVIVLLPTVPLFVLPWAAFGGAFATAFITFQLAWKKGSSPIRLILVGIGVASVVHALITLIMTFGHIQLVSQATIWMTGSVYGRSWEHFWPLLPWIIVLLPTTLLLSRHLDVLQLGDDLARGLGSRIEWQRGILLLTSVALAGSAVATAGTVSFIGLMAPHIARKLIGPSHGGLIITAALMGGLIVVLADLIGRTILAPIEIPVGIITAIVGAPYLIYLLYRERNS